MYEKGYIDPEIITMDYASFVPKLAQNAVASFYGPLGVYAGCTERHHACLLPRLPC